MEYYTQEEKWQALEAEVNRRGGDGADLVAAMKELYSIYDNRMLVWLAKLYDKESGGFYYSNSARDNDELVYHIDGDTYKLLPDIESTLQASCIMAKTGMVESHKELPKALRKKIAEFAISLQDPDDGYIYHPQWNRSISRTRRGRDLEWAIALSADYGFRLPYPTANKRIKMNAKSKNQDPLKAKKLPMYFVSPDAFREYLKSLTWDTNPGAAGSALVSQAQQIMAAGFTDIAINFINSRQNKSTGLWGERSDRKAVVDYMKITGLYIEVGAPIQHAVKASMAAINALNDQSDIRTVCDQYDVWFALRNIMLNLRRHEFEQGKRKLEIISEELLKCAPRAIRLTAEKYRKFKKPDGSFSYLEKVSSPISQSAPVAPRGSIEGDVNGTTIASVETIDKIYAALELSDFYVPLFGKEDYKVLLDALDL